MRQVQLANSGRLDYASPSGAAQTVQLMNQGWYRLVETRKYILAKVPMGRMGEPAEIAAVAHLLASDEAGFTTGQVYDASGGRATY